MHNNGTSNNGPINAVIRNNTITNCGAGEVAAVDTAGGSSFGNTYQDNLGEFDGTGSCGQFVANGEMNNNGAEPGCPGTGDTRLTPSFTSTEPSDPGATYATSNVNPAWGYQVGCTSSTVCHGRVGYDAHIPVS
jgi:hypothetical protein